jgi:uncharacterized protein YkwD
MKLNFIGMVLLFCAINTITSCSSDTPKTASPTISTQKNISYTYNSSEIETLTLVNNYRISVGLKALEQNNYVSLKSEEHNYYMITNNVVSHDGFSIRSQNIIDAIGAKRVGENIAYNYSTAKAALDAWLTSPTHKGCIEGDFTHFGIAIRVNSEGKKYYTNIFVKI